MTTTLSQPLEMTGSERLLFILTLGLMSGLGPLAIDMYLPALPSIAREMGEPLSRIQYTLSAYTIGFALSQLIYGPLSDRIGRRIITLLGLVFFVITSVLAAMCETALELIIVRALQAFAAAGIMVTVPAMIRDSFPSDQVAKALSSIMVVTTIAPLVAPMLGGQVLNFAGWPAIFLFLAIVSAVVLVIAIFRIKETLHESRRSTVPVSQLASTYKSIITHRDTSGCLLCNAFFFSGMFAFIAGSPFVYIELFGVLPENYGFFFGMNIVAMMLINMLNIRLVGRFKLFSILRAGSWASATFAAITLINSITGFGGLMGIAIPIALYIGCLGLTGPNSNALSMEYFPKAAGATTALGGAMRFGMSGLASALVGLLHDGTSFPMVIVMFGAGVCSVLSLLLVKSKSEVVEVQIP